VTHINMAAVMTSIVAVGEVLDELSLCHSNPSNFFYLKISFRELISSLSLTRRRILSISFEMERSWLV
jgi:hypothetical protein